jgi:hypothetical protein
VYPALPEKASTRPLLTPRPIAPIIPRTRQPVGNGQTDVRAAEEAFKGVALTTSRHFNLWYCVLLTCAAGCVDGGRGSFFQSGEPVPPARRQTAAATQPRPATRPAATQPEKGSLVQENLPEAFLQVVLTNDPGTSKPPRDMTVIHLRLARADAAARLLEMLYVPVGAGGGTAQQYLIYQTPVMWKAAGEAAGFLDVRMAEQLVERPPLQYQEAFNTGVALAMRALRPGRLDVPSLTGAEECLKTAATADAAPARLRWTAAILAGRLLGDLASKSDEACGYFRLAEKHAPEGSVEKMTALHHQADALQQQGRRKEAAAILQRILTDFTMYHQTGLYQQCRRMAQE